MKLVNHTLISGVFPDILKVAKIVPIHKKGDEHRVMNCTMLDNMDS